MSEFWITTKSLIYTVIVFALIIAALAGGIILIPILLLVAVAIALFIFIKAWNDKSDLS